MKKVSVRIWLDRVWYVAVKVDGKLLHRPEGVKLPDGATDWGNDASGALRFASLAVDHAEKNEVFDT